MKALVRFILTPVGHLLFFFDKQKYILSEVSCISGKVGHFKIENGIIKTIGKGTILNRNYSSLSIQNQK